jgi:hypothetical protein
MTDAEHNKFVDTSLDPNMFRRPDYFVYIYSVADSDLVRELPPQISRLTIPGRGKERYKMATQLAHPWNQPDVDANGKRICHYLDATRLAMDICNPENTSSNQDLILDARNVFSEGNNYSRKGVFFSRHNPPLEAEIVAAEQRKETYYRTRLQRLRALEVSDPKALNETLGKDDHLAAEYFGEEFTWHRVARRKAECPNCGEGIKQGVAFHFLPNNRICVNDWDRAIAAGAVDAKDRPVAAKKVAKV